MTFPRRAAAALAVVAAACSDTLGSFRNVVVPGEYVLEAVNGRALPIDLRNDAAGRLSLTGGQLTITGEAFSQELSLVEFAPDGTTTPRQSAVTGDVSYHSSNRVRFRVDRGGGEWEGTYYGNAQGGGYIEYTIEGNNGPILFRFEKTGAD